ncbi:MAG: hypothetical protein ACOX2K_00580 [Bacillota bacterium]|jgi:hypothetical protein
MQDDRWREFIAGAELAWFRVFSSSQTMRSTMPDGAPIGMLPGKFSTRRKIYRYFRLWFGPRLAKNMLANLPLIERQGRLCVIQFDFPPISMTPGQVKIERANAGTWRLHTTLSGGWPDEQIRYRVLACPECRPMIVRRSGAYDDFRYQASPHCEE